MKKLVLIIVTAIITVPGYMLAQDTPARVSCKAYMDNKIIDELTVENALKWMELTPPTVQCGDKVYKLTSFQVNFMTLKPFMNHDFGIGEGGFPIMAVNAVKKAGPGDTIILKEVTYTDSTGTVNKLPVISLKLQ